MAHLLIDLTFHGYGHVGQTAPVIRRLRELEPNLKITVRSAIPFKHLASRLPVPFHHLPVATDLGIPMLSFREVDRAECLRAYESLHENWDRAVDTCAKATRDVAPDLVLSNASYLALAAAERAGIPSIGYSSLNWADLYEFYSAGELNADRIVGEMRDAYRSADLFLKVQPSMPMNWLPNAVEIGAVAQIGSNRRREILDRLHLPGDSRLVLAAFGGMPVEIDCSAWPDIPNTHFLVPFNWRGKPGACTPLDTLAMPFADLVRSCDAVMAKPGYGIVVEAACCGTAFLSVPRLDWPEQDILVEWLKRHGTIGTISPDRLVSGDIASVLKELVPIAGRRRASCLKPTGIEEAAHFLHERLAGAPGPRSRLSDQFGDGRRKPMRLAVGG